MRRNVALVLIAVALVITPLFAQERETIAEKYKWNLKDLYASDEAWRAAKDKLTTEVPSITQFKGKLGSSAQDLLAAMDKGAELRKELSRLYVYAALAADQDTRIGKYQAMKQEMSQLATSASSQSSYMEPEIQKLDRAKIDSFIKAEPKLAVYSHYLDDVLRRKAHTGNEGEERIIADAGLMSDAPSEFFNLFTYSDFPYPTVTLSGGREVKLDQAGYVRERSGANRDDRAKVFAAFFDAIGKFRNTYGADMNANIQKDVFYMKARNYKSTVESSLDSNNIPVAVYTSLVDGVNANLPTFHRYLTLRKRMMGVDQLHYYDLYAPLVASVDKKYTVEEAQGLIAKAVGPLGDDYVATINRAFNDRWLDLFPNTGKRSGAYSEGAAYDVHPYMLINFVGGYHDVSTLAHELGHTMQSYFSNKTQPYPTADYPIFVAEVASTFNEALLFDSMLKNVKDDPTRLAMLGEYLENARLTVFRQTQFAEFELRAHQMAEKGEPITGEAMDKLYLDITRKYYGDEKGVCKVDDYIAHEWAYIPHFYRNYYVFQYATSFTASQALSEKVLAGDKGEVKRYRDFLSAGGSKYPIELLRDAGVDMTTSEPLDLTMKKLNRIMDEIDKILARQGKAKK